MVAALSLPALAFLLWIAGPLGWVHLRSRGDLLAMARHPLGRLSLAVLVTLCLFHWAHRFRYTLYDGLQLKHLNALIAVICYGGAAAGSLATVVILLSLS
jgi:fumarate reductase subunit D